jgi:small subunit ribosomal protein S15
MPRKQVSIHRSPRMTGDLNTSISIYRGRECDSRTRVQYYDCQKNRSEWLYRISRYPWVYDDGLCIQYYGTQTDSLKEICIIIHFLYTTSCLDWCIFWLDTFYSKILFPQYMEHSEKKALMESFATKKGDTGSPEVQVAILTSRIESLKNHLEIHKQDNHSRRGIVMMVAKRRKLLDYLKRKDEARYTVLIGKLDLRK